ncbi:MAG: hypothetical protein [Bacteriophage sp.]|nr:MAG: hypothetical protein [Bacteriophage sp.]
MRHLYRFTCKPNYPVVSQAVLVFHSCYHVINRLDALLEAKKLARDMGICYAEDDSCLLYLGQIEVIASMRDLPILAVVTGEY